MNEIPKVYKKGHTYQIWFKNYDDNDEFVSNGYALLTPQRDFMAGTVGAYGTISPEGEKVIEKELGLTKNQVLMRTWLMSDFPYQYSSLALVPVYFIKNVEILEDGCLRISDEDQALILEEAERQKLKNLGGSSVNEIQVTPRELLWVEYGKSKERGMYTPWLEDRLLEARGEIQVLDAQVKGLIAERDAIKPASPNSSRTQLYDELETARGEIRALKNILRSIGFKTQGVL